MIIKIENCNYYVKNARKKSPQDIFEEIFKRSSLTFVSKQRKKEIIKLICEQIYN